MTIRLIDGMVAPPASRFELPGVRSVELFTYRWVCVVNVANPVARAAALSLEPLAGMCWVAPFHPERNFPRVRVESYQAGDCGRVAEAITAQADKAGLKGDQRRGADACVRYLTGKAEFLRYDHALAQGWPIATGVIEGPCRHLIADRLDISGARWGLAGAEAVLKLRAVHSNNDFDAYWRYHVTRKHERLYQTTDQAEYTLTA